MNYTCRMIISFPSWKKLINVQKFGSNKYIILYRKDYFENLAEKSKE